jgi:hypothetical protein
MTKPTKHPRFLYLIPGLLVIAFLALVFWPQSPPSAEAIANRGKKAPADKSFSLLEPSTWKTSSGIGWDWLDQGFDAVMEWDKNPWKHDKLGFSTHLENLRTSKDPKDQAEYRRLLELAKTWHQNLLERYPELKQNLRNIPDAENALIQCLELKKKLTAEKGAADFSFPTDLRQQLDNSKPWDSAAARAWLDANRGLVDEIRRISQLTGSSTAGLGSESLFMLRDCGTALLIEARLAAENGDAQAAFASVEAANRLSNLLVQSDSPYLLHELLSSGIRDQTRNTVLQAILPALAAQQQPQDLGTWASLFQTQARGPADLSNLMKGEWNGMMQYYILPALLDSSESRNPADADLFVESYTRYIADQVKQFETITTVDLSSSSRTDFDDSQLSWRSQQLGKDMSNVDYRHHWLRGQLRAGLTQAAFDILQGNPVPNDPIYGQPYQWNPETRELSLPKGREFSQMKNRPIKLPKL